MNTGIKIQIFIFDDSIVIIEKLFSFLFLVTSFSTTIPLLLLAKRKEKKRREFKAEMEKSKVTLRKVIHKR